LSVVSVVCCQVEVSATRWSLIQRSPTYVARRCVWSRYLVNEEALTHWGQLHQKQKKNSVCISLKGMRYQGVGKTI